MLNISLRVCLAIVAVVLAAPTLAEGQARLLLPDPPTFNNTEPDRDTDVSHCIAGDWARNHPLSHNSRCHLGRGAGGSGRYQFRFVNSCTHDVAVTWRVNNYGETEQETYNDTLESGGDSSTVIRPGQDYHADIECPNGDPFITWCAYPDVLGGRRASGCNRWTPTARDNW